MSNAAKSTTKSKPKKRRKLGERLNVQGFRGNEGELADCRIRVGEIYGLEFDPDLLDDDELRQVYELTKRLVDVEAPTRSGFDMTADRRRANAFAEGVREKMVEHAALLERSPDLRQSTERRLEFATRYGRVPTDGDVAVMARGGTPSVFPSAGTVRAVDFNAINQEETEMLEGLVAKAAGLAPTHFADLRLRSKIRELAARATKPAGRPMRRRDEPGTVTLPAEIFTVMAANTVDGRSGDFLVSLTAPAVAALALLLHVFSDRSSPLLYSAVAAFDEDGATLRVQNGMMPFPMTVDPGQHFAPGWRQTLEELATQGWITVESNGAVIRLGDRAQALFVADASKTKTSVGGETNG